MIKTSFSAYIRLINIFPFLMAIVLLGMNTLDAGIDLGAQIFNLERAENENIIDLFSLTNERPTLFYGIYVIIHRWIGITPLAFLSFVCFLHYSLYLFIFRRYLYFNIDAFNIMDSTLAVIIILTAFNPLFMSVTRYLFAIDMILLGCGLIYVNRRIIGGICVFIPLYIHEGAILIWIILLFSWILNKFVFAHIKSIFVRNVFIIAVCFMLFNVGTVIYSYWGSYFSNQGYLSDRYTDLYINVDSGDGNYAFVLLLSLLAPFYMLVSTVIKNRNNNYLNCICVTVLFAICLFLNQKVFLVERMIMFVVPFMGLSLLQIIKDEQLSFSNSLYLQSLLCVPVEFLFICYFQSKLLFPWLYDLI